MLKASYGPVSYKLPVTEETTLSHTLLNNGDEFNLRENQFVCTLGRKNEWSCCYK